MVLYILFVQDFTTVLHDFVALLVVWLAPVRGGVDDRRADAPLALRPGRRSTTSARRGAYWGWHGINVRGWIALLAGVARVPADHQRADLTGR